jgi:hypothetical protein
METDIPDREPELTALERRLAAWRPATGALDRDRMLYDAGRAAAGARPWRLATAALMLVSLGLGGLLVQQRSLLGRERALLALERARRLELETALAGRNEAPRPSPRASAPAADVPPIGSPAPGSYLALTARLADGVADVAWPGGAAEPASQRPVRNPTGEEWHPSPLRPQDIQRILDL